MDDSRRPEAVSGICRSYPGERSQTPANGTNRLPKLNTRVRFPSSAPRLRSSAVVSSRSNKLPAAILDRVLTVTRETPAPQSLADVPCHSRICRNCSGRRRLVACRRGQHHGARSSPDPFMRPQQRRNDERTATIVGSDAKPLCPGSNRIVPGDRAARRALPGRRLVPVVIVVIPLPRPPDARGGRYKHPWRRRNGGCIGDAHAES